MREPEKVIDMGALAEALREAHAFCLEKETAANAASAAHTSAKNRLNDAQKAFDVAVKALRSGAPWDSHWHQEDKRKSERVSV